MVTISIDPDFDSPDRLQRYAKAFQAQDQWSFYTGRVRDIVEIQKAFDAYRGNKMRHEPLTFLRAGRDQPWVRFNGLLSAGELADEYFHLVGRPRDATNE